MRLRTGNNKKQDSTVGGGTPLFGFFAVGQGHSRDWKFPVPFAVSSFRALL